MNVSGIVQAIISAVTALGALVGVLSRRQRLRANIRENLKLVAELEAVDDLRESPVVTWLQGRITIDVARLAGVPVTAPKRPIPWAGLVFASLMAVGFGFWTALLDWEKFVWYSVFPGVVVFVMSVAVLGMLTNREEPQDARANVAPGGLPAGSEGSTA